MLHQKKGIDRTHIFRKVAEMIQKSGKTEIELSTSELADHFNVQAPTMDYHLTKLVDEGKLALSPKRGRYKRKVYRLPAYAQELPELFPDPSEEKETEDEVKEEISIQENAVALPLVESTVPSEAIQEPVITPSVEAIIPPFAEEPKTEILPIQRGDSVVRPLQEWHPAMRPPKIEEDFTAVKPLNLDDRIEDFLNQTKSVESAENLLKRDDRELLAVISESIQQSMVYLKDLSDQLSTVQNKQLIQHLLDERNRANALMQEQKVEIEKLRQEILANRNNVSIDENRIHHMKQVIFNTLDSYLELPNHSLALRRREFKNQITQEILHLTNYVLNMEE